MVRLSFFLTAVERRISMSKYIPGNQKHLSLEDRIYIENELNKGETFKNIAGKPMSAEKSFSAM